MNERTLILPAYTLFHRNGVEIIVLLVKRWAADRKCAYDSTFWSTIVYITNLYNSNHNNNNNDNNNNKNNNNNNTITFKYIIN